MKKNERKPQLPDLKRSKSRGKNPETPMKVDGEGSRNFKVKRQRKQKNEKEKGKYTFKGKTKRHDL
jgi:hypothetical protein